MASENKNENVLLTGQTAYFKKSGSMTNFGVIELNTQDSSSNYGPGFIDEGSKIHAVKLETSNDYKNTEIAMQNFLGEFYDDELAGYKVKENAIKINEALTPYYIKLQEYANKIGMYKELPYLTTVEKEDLMSFDGVVTLPKNFSIQLDIEPDIGNNSIYNIFRSENNEIRFWKDDHNRLCFNDTILNIDKELEREDTIVINQVNTEISIYINGDLINKGIVGVDSSIDVNIFENFAGIIYSMKVYNRDTEEEVVNIKPFFKKDVGGGLLDVISNVFYEMTQGVAKLFIPKVRAYLYSNSFIDLKVLPNPNTGIEIDFRTASTTNQLRIFDVSSGFSVSGTMSLSLYRNGSGQWAYARNNNVGNWVSTGVSANTTRTTCSINKQNNGKIIMSGGATVNANLSGTVTNSNTGNKTIWLNATNDIGAYTRPESKTYIGGSYALNVYSIKVWDDQELIRDYVPAIDIVTNKPCLYDKVNNEYYFISKGTMYVYDS